jgi:hypothetical protein
MTRVTRVTGTTGTTGVTGTSRRTGTTWVGVATRRRAVAYGHEVMSVTDDVTAARIARLFDDAGADYDVIADLDLCLARLRRAQEARRALSGLSAADLRAALERRRRRAGEAR